MVVISAVGCEFAHPPRSKAQRNSAQRSALADRQVEPDLVHDWREKYTSYETRDSLGVGFRCRVIKIGE